MALVKTFGADLLKANADAAGGFSTTKYSESTVGLSSFAALRTRRPNVEGERIFIKGWNAANPGYGAGFFTGSLTAGTDDGGYIAAGSDFHWTRDVNLSDLSVEDFGAVPGGTLDAGPACTAFLEFMMSSTASDLTGYSSIAQARVKFKAGTYLVNPVDWRSYGTALASSDSDYGYYPTHHSAHGGIQIEGVSTGFGKTLYTKIISDKSTTPVFQLNHRRMSIKFIEWDGQQTTGYDDATQLLNGATVGVFNDTASNQQPFIKNDCVGGLFARIECFNAKNTGEYTFYLLDTLDSKFDQIYSSKTAGPVFKIGWSNRTAGSWDHSTAIELSNANFQYAFAPAVWAPRSTQCLMRNVWFEHSTCTFDLNNSQWLMEMVSVESSTANPVMYRCRAQVHGFSGPTGNQLDYKTAPTDSTWPSYALNPDGSAITEWLSYFERGYNRLETFGAELSGSVKAKYYSGVLRGTNNTGSAVWVNLGVITWPNTGGIWEFEVLCRNGYSSVGTGTYTPTGDRTPGKTIIRAQRGSGSIPIITYFHEGSSAVSAVQYGAQSSNDILPSLWIQLSSYAGEYLVNATSTGPTRFDAGTCTRFEPDGTTQTASPGLTAATARFSIHNGSAGIGAQGSNLAVACATGTPTSTTAPAGYFAVVGPAGTLVYLPYYV